MKKKTLIAPILIAALILLTGCGDPEPLHISSPPTRARPTATPAFRVTAVELKAEQAKITGPCPATVKFSGLIHASGSGQVSYVFVRSDGITSPVRTVNFSGSGTQAVSDVWTPGDAADLSSFDGWETLKVLSPNELESGREEGSFSITCER
jgi:hypothetical protein